MSLITKIITLTDQGITSGPIYTLYYSPNCVEYTQSVNVNLFYLGQSVSVEVPDTTSCIKLVSNGKCTNEVIKIIPTTTTTTIPGFCYNAARYECIDGVCEFQELIDINNETELIPASGFRADPTTGYIFEVLDYIACGGGYLATSMTGEGSEICNEVYCVTTTTTTLAPTTTTTLAPTTTTTTVVSACIEYRIENNTETSIGISYYDCNGVYQSGELGSGQQTTFCANTSFGPIEYSSGQLFIIGACATTTTTVAPTTTTTLEPTTTTTVAPTTTTTTCANPTLYLASTSNDACNQINGQLLTNISHTDSNVCPYCNWTTLNSTEIPSLANGTYYVSDGTNVRSWIKASTPSNLYGPSACSSCPLPTTTTTLAPTTTTTTSIFRVTVRGTNENTPTDAFKIQFNLNGGSWTNMTPTVNNDTTCRLMSPTGGGFLDVPSGTNVCFRLIESATDSTIIFDYNLTNSCPTSIATLNCGRCILSIAADTSISFLAQVDSGTGDYTLCS